MIKKILMISDNDITSDRSLGVTKKLLGQYKAFNNLGFDTYHLCFKDEQGVLIHGEETKVLVKKHKKLYFTYIKLLGMAHKVCLENSIELCYIRYPLADFAFMGMIKKLHKICKVVIEMPTFPYDHDLAKETNLITKFNAYQDKKNREKIKDYIDFFTNFHGYSSIFGAKALAIDNGIDASSVNYIGDKINFSNDVNIIGVALIINIHGYDRIIEGLKNYYAEPANTKTVNFYIVGDGPETPYLKSLVNDYGLTKHVIFTGTKKGKELDELFEKSNVAVASLAAHRRGGKNTSELKVKEYCARGIPFIATSTDRTLPENPNFVKVFPADESPIDICEVVNFAESCNRDPDISKNMRKFAEENLTWEKQLKKVIDAI